MKTQLTVKSMRFIFSFLLCDAFFSVNNAMATEFTAPSTAITIEQSSGSWIQVQKTYLFGAPPGYDGIRNGCQSLGNDGHGYAACGTTELQHSGNYGGEFNVMVHKYTGKISGPNNSTIDVGIAFDNMGVYYAGQKYNTGHADARAGILPLSRAGYIDPSQGFTDWRLSNNAWDGGTWGIWPNNGCIVFNMCVRTKGIIALVPYNAQYGSQAVGTISLYIRVPNNIAPGTYSGRVLLGSVSLEMDLGHNGSSSAHASIYGNFEVTIPKRCKISFPSSVTFDTINSGGNQSTAPLQTKNVTFTSECSGLAESSVKAELLLESDSFDTAIGAVMFDAEKTLGVKASLNPVIDCSSKSNELFNNQFLLVEHPKSTGKSTQSKNIYIALCKYGLITKPGDYSKSINAKVIYSTP